MKKIFLIVVVFCFSLSSCERDDVCDPTTPTTPMLVIEFYDFFIQSNPKVVTNLAIAEVGNIIGFAPVTGTKIKIPLKTDQNVTKYRLIKNFNDPVNPLINEDILEFSYTRKNEYISRACGFKNIFLLNTGLPVQSEPATPDGIWIKGIEIFQPNISNEDETHIKIYL